MDSLPPQVHRTSSAAVERVEDRAVDFLADLEVPLADEVARPDQGRSRRSRTSEVFTFRSDLRERGLAEAVATG